MARPKSKVKRKTLSTTIEIELLEKMKEISKEKKIPLNRLIEVAVKKWLEEEGKEKKIKGWKEMCDEANKLKSPSIKHKIFVELTKYIEFYDSMENSIWSHITAGVDKFNINSDFLSSIKGTITSIRLSLECGNINDAFSLLRKYQDISVMHIYSILYLENNFSIDNITVKEINDWVKEEEKSPNYKKMIKYIANSEKTKKITNVIKKKNNIDLRQRFNDHAHFNFYSYLSLNDSTRYNFNNDKTTFLNQFSNDINIIYVSHFIWLFTVKEYYMTASDYVDYLDMGEEPPENSQYWVSPFIQEMFSEVIKKTQPNLSAEFKKEIEFMELK